MMTLETFAGTPQEDAYLRHAPNPEDFPVLVEKQKVLPQEFAFPDEDVAAIAAPTLLIYGDSDVVRPEHAVALFRLLEAACPAVWSVSPARSWPSSPASRTPQSCSNASTN